VVAPGFARRLGAALTASEGIALDGAGAGATAGLPATDATGGQSPRA